MDESAYLEEREVKEDKEFEFLLARLLAVESDRKQILDKLRQHPEYVGRISDRIMSLSESAEDLTEKISVLEKIIGWKPSLKVRDYS